MWDEDFVNAKYHLAVAERMLVSYGEVGDKRFLIGIIREAAEAATKIVLMIMKFENFRGDRRLVTDDGLNFFLKVAPKYLDRVTCENLFRVLEVARAQRDSPIEYARGDKIILLIGGRYRILTVDRIREFVGSIGDAIGKLRQV